MKPMNLAKSRGFTMLELLFATTLLTILSLAALPFAIDKANTSTADVVVAEVYSVGSAAQTYRATNGAWPDQANGCAGSINVLSSAGILPTFVTDGSGNPLDSWTGTLVTTCAANAPFVVKANPRTGDTNNLKYARYAASKLFAATVDNAAQSVASSFVVPGFEPGFDQLLHRYRDAAHPEFNQMQTDIDMNSNSISNAKQFTWAYGESLLGADGSSANAGVIELGKSQTATTGHYIDFHMFPSEDYNVRLANGYTSALGPVQKDGGFYIVARQLVLGGEDNYMGHNLSYPGDLFTHGGLDLCNLQTAISTYANTTVANEGASRGCHIQTNGGFVESLASGTAFSSPNGAYVVGTAGASFQPDQGGSLELGGSNTTAGTGSPYIDFHYNGLTQDFNTRIVNDANGQITLVANNVHLSNTLQVDGNESVGGYSQAQDYKSTIKGRTISQGISDAYQVDAAASAADRTITKPTCPPGFTPTILTTLSQVAEGSSAYPLHQIRTYAVDNNNGTWTVNMDVVTDDTSGTPKVPASGYGRMLAMTKCS